MKTYRKMPAGLRHAYRNELFMYRQLMAGNDFQQAWHRLERAHIIGQPWAVEHTEVHWMMLKFGIRIKNAKEVIGQLPRLLVGGVKSFVGKIPTGNTGGANVPPLQKMEMPEDLKTLMKPFL